MERIPLSAELMAWMLDEIVRETDCYLVLDVTDGSNRYVQFAAREDGSLQAESVSNTFAEDGDVPLTSDEELRLLGLGWEPPTCGWPVPQGTGRFQSPNFYRLFEVPVPIGTAALLAARTLEQIHGVRYVDQLELLYWKGEGVRRPKAGSEGGRRALWLGRPEPGESFEQFAERAADELTAALAREDERRSGWLLSDS